MRPQGNVSSSTFSLEETKHPTPCLKNATRGMGLHTQKQDPTSSTPQTRTDWFCAMKERVCSDNHEDSRRNEDKLVVKIRVECRSAKLELIAHWQLHACRSWFAGREKWGGTTIASAGPIHTAHSLGTRVLYLPLVFPPSPFPLGSMCRLPFLSPLPPFKQESCSAWLSALSHSLSLSKTRRCRSSLSLQGRLCTYFCLLVPNVFQYPLFPPS